MRKFRTSMALVIALLNSAVALAGEAGEGTYAGLDLGKSSYRQPGSDERDPSFALTVGYRITPALALEGQARSLSLRINVPFADKKHYPSGHLALAVVGTLAIAGDVSLVGRGGVGRTTMRSARVANPDRHLVEAITGGGIAYQWAPQWQVSLEAMRLSRSRLTVMSLGARYAF